MKRRVVIGTIDIRAEICRGVRKKVKTGGGNDVGIERACSMEKVCVGTDIAKVNDGDDRA